METILITGGTGLVGSHLCKRLLEKGYYVNILGRNSKPDADTPVYAWDIDKNEIESAAIESADFIIHLAGANIGDQRWSNNRKKLIVDSRVKTGGLIFEKTKEIKNKIKVFVTASAIGYYGTITSDKIFRETDPPANDFLGQTCQLWEQSADRFKELGIRTVKIRTGVVLTREGGALSKMITPIKIGLGSAIGNGQQYLPWIHIDDLCGIYIKAIEDIHMKGAYNAVAPEYISNRDFNAVIASVLKKPFWFPDIPAIALKILFGEMSGLLLCGSRISAEKIMEEEYNFKFATLQIALNDLLEKNK